MALLSVYIKINRFIYVPDELKAREYQISGKL